MKAAANVEDLQVAGYANVLSQNMLPWIVAPIFRWKADPDRYILPPFYLDAAGTVRNGAEVDTKELADLQAAEEITLFAPDAVFNAQQNFELWIDQNFVPHYEPAGVARRKLREIGQQYDLLAQAALRAGNLEQADEFAGVAISADDRLIPPLVIRAVICRVQGNRAGERLMIEMASTIPPEDFNALVDKYQALANRPQQVHPALLGAAGSPTRGMAAVR